MKAASANAVPRVVLALGLAAVAASARAADAAAWRITWANVAGRWEPVDASDTPTCD